MTELGDSIKPVYRFTWADGTQRRTDNIEDPKSILGSSGVEVLADLGRDDPDCEVEQVGFET